MPEQSPPKALVCIPTYNERGNIERIIPAVLTALPAAHILIIDDNSPDGTGDVADEFAKQDARVHVLHRKGKEGLGRAYIAGFRWALARDYDIVFEFDADFSHNPKYLPAFVERLATCDVVVGSRRVRGGGVENWGPLRRFVSFGGSLYARLVLAVTIKDLTGGFNGFTRKALQAIDLDAIKNNGYGFQIELKYRCVRQGFKVCELPIVFPDRTLGKSKMTGAIFGEAFINVLKLRFDPSIGRAASTWFPVNVSAARDSASRDNRGKDCA